MPVKALKINTLALTDLDLVISDSKAKYSGLSIVKIGRIVKLGIGTSLTYQPPRNKSPEVIKVVIVRCMPPIKLAKVITEGNMNNSIPKASYKKTGPFEFANCILSIAEMEWVLPKKELLALRY